jgi:hypothetical protein
MWRLRERWERGLGGRTAGIIAPHAGTHHSANRPPVITGTDIVGPAWVVDVTFAPKLPMRAIGNTRRLLHAGKTVAWRLDPGQRWEGPFNQGDGLVVDGRLLAGAFDLITALELLLFTDTLAALEQASDPVPTGSIVLGNPAAIGIHGADVEPGVVLDARKGAIVLDRGVQVRSGTRLEGPFWAGAGTMILGGQLRSVSAGPLCPVRRTARAEIHAALRLGWRQRCHGRGRPVHRRGQADHASAGSGSGRRHGSRVAGIARAHGAMTG